MSGNSLKFCAHAAYQRISQVIRTPGQADTAPSDWTSSAAMDGLENHLGLAAAVELRSLQVVDEGSLRTGTGLGDQVTELVLGGKWSANGKLGRTLVGVADDDC